jgi:hypothetical protein
MAQMTVQLTAGDVELGRATVDLGRDGHLKHWSVYGSFDGIGPMPEDTTVQLTLPDGRVLTGHAFLEHHQMSSNAGGTYTHYSYLGTGPLNGADEYEFS